ncbi:UNVERIFIED_CONTAM: hypothetical protein Slati_2249300 [Sesamum latifolium]|uniref:Retrotransposon gag domain-containing protein n=1 Tax=Sesamum latifolium TaxID=2727402 RepID=A0AAW2WVH0_9LAMI
MPAPPRPADPAADPPRITVSPDAPSVELSSNIFGTIQQMITSAIREQLTILVPTRVTTFSEVTAPEQANPAEATPTLNNAEGLTAPLPPQVMGAFSEEQAGIPFTEGVTTDELLVNCWTSIIAEYDGTTDPQEHLSHFENAALLHRYTNDIKCRVFVTTFARAAQQWFNQLPPAAIGSFQEFRSLFLHQFASSRRHRKIELSLFSIRLKEGESLKEYLQRFNTASLEVPSATQEVNANTFAQGLLDGDFFKSLAKKPATKFDTLLARTTKYLNMEHAQASKREGRGEKRKENKDECPSKSRRWTSKTKNQHDKE